MSTAYIYIRSYKKKTLHRLAMKLDETPTDHGELHSYALGRISCEACDSPSWPRLPASRQILPLPNPTLTPPSMPAAACGRRVPWPPPAASPGAALPPSQLKDFGPDPVAVVVQSTPAQEQSVRGWLVASPSLSWDGVVVHTDFSHAQTIHQSVFGCPNHIPSGSGSYGKLELGIRFACMRTYSIKWSRASISCEQRNQTQAKCIVSIWMALCMVWFRQPITRWICGER